MSAAAHVGRIGGLAVALGVGAAVLTGYGVAAADTGSGESGSSASSGSSAGSSTGGTDSSTAGASSPSANAGDGDDASDSDEAADASEGDDASESDDGDDTAGDSEDLDADLGVDEGLEADGDVDGDDPVDSGGYASAESEAPAEVVDDVDSAAPSDGVDSTVVSDEVDAELAAERQDQAVEWLATPEAVAGRAGTEQTAPAEQTAAAEESVDATAAVPDVALTEMVGLLSPFAGGGPAAPPMNSPMEWAMAAAARRELESGPVSVNPVLEFLDGVIYGNVGATDSRGNPLIYTIIDEPSQGGKITLAEDGSFSFLPDLSVVESGGTEQFTVMVSEQTGLVRFLEQIPLLGDFVEPIVLGLQQIPILGTILQPFIGYRVIAPIDVNVGELVPAGAPVAFTTMVTSFDGVQISTNFFPASGLQAGETASTVLNGPGLGDPGNIDPTSVTTVFNLVPGLVPLRDAGYNVVTWDPRGEFASGGVLQLDNPFFEGRDVQAILDWVATRPETLLDGPGDPVVGMVGGSYGGGIQLVSAGIDDRIEAIVPVIAWNSLNEALYPTEAFKTAWATLLGLDLLEGGARINSQIYPAIILGDLLGFITETQQAILASSGPTVLVSGITAPTLLIQGTADGLFTLAQAVTNAMLLEAAGTPVDMIWACGGHGVCLDPISPLQTPLLIDSTLDWLDKYVNGNELVPTGPRFEWFDQNGDYFFSDLLPSDPAFYGESLVVAGAGGFLPILPLLGGSGPQTQSPTPLLVSPALASEAALAIDVEVPSPEATVQIVGAPELTITYSGLGTSRHIYGQLVDETTGLVLGNLVTPIPVTLDGRTHTVSIDLEQIAYTMAPDSQLKLQLVGSATPYENLLQLGFINVEAVELALPTVAAEVGGVAGLTVGMAVA
ncbi:peptidase S15 [Mycolicibacterium sp. 3033]|nr:peptidase S15 [Mycolicibacterium aurantiacum]